MKLRCKNTIKLHKANSTRGSSSVLVIMIMLLLITFGVLAMMSSYSNLKIARKNADWTQGYYRLESAAELDMMTFKTLYEEAIGQTNNLLNGGALDENVLKALPVEMQTAIKSSYQQVLTSNETSSPLFERQLFLYQFFVAYKKSTLIEKQLDINFDETALTNELEKDWQPELSFVSKDNDTNRSLLVKVTFDNSKKANGYTVLEWREIPANFEYEELLEFEDPEGN